MTRPTDGRRTAIFTICSNNYVPFARILLESCRRHHPDATLFLGLADSKLSADFYDDSWTVIAADELNIPDFRAFAFRYDVMEFNTAIKPYLFLHLYDRFGFDDVIYFDPDIELYRPLDTVLNPLGNGAPFVLTPHLCSPAEVGQDPDDVTIMRAGIYNLGFLGTSRSRQTLEVLHWWARRLRFQCINAQEKGIFVDQKFMDLVPGFADDVHISRDMTLNVAYWNLSQRVLALGKDGFTIDGKPLGFFHFSGFDPNTPDRLSKHTELFSTAIQPELKRLINAYGARLLANGHGQIPRGIYAYGRFASGTPIPALVRKMFRETHEDWPTDPFDTYEAFLDSMVPGAAHTATHVVTQLMAFLRTQFPHLANRLALDREGDVRELVEWFARWSERDLKFDPRITAPAAMRFGTGRPRRASLAFASATEGADVTVIGYLKTSSGVGEAGRHTLSALASRDLEAQGVDVDLNVVSARGDDSVAEHLVARGTGRAQIFHVNADQLQLVQDHVRDRLAPDALRIAVPFWELSGWPQAWAGAFSGVDEIWAPSRFVQSALARGVDKPVIHMPMAIELPRPALLDRTRLGLPEDKFLFFYAFDFLSFMQRKNPFAALDAFQKAFPTRGEAGLVFKTMNGHLAPQQFAAFRERIGTDANVMVIDGTLPRDRTLALISACDCIMSLHRSEGLGLLVAEAMLLERPVIATDYSATTDLLSPSTGYPVDYKLVPVQEGEYPHATGQVWAEADIGHAAWLMRDVRMNGADARRKVQRARRHVLDTHGRSRVAARMHDRLALLGVVERG